MNDYDKKLFGKITEVFENKHEHEAASDALKLLCGSNDKEAHEFNLELRKKIIDVLRVKADNRLMDVLRNSFKFDATVSFDAFMRFMEWDRDPEKQFYMPRRKIIKSMWVDPIQDLVDDKLDLLCLSCPPGTGKTTVGNFLLAFVMGREPDRPNLASAHSGTLTESFYKSVFALISDPEYNYREIFNTPIAKQNAMMQTIDLVKEHRFSTLTCRAINASLTGATRCENLLYADDMCSGIEEAMNPERLDSLWVKYTNDLKSRKKQGCKEIHIATRWSVRDVIGRLEDLYCEDPRAKFIKCPALNENDESNFDYDYNVGFNTQYFIDMRKNLDDVSWRALFLNEPIEREGLLFCKDELRYYYELPQEDPDYIIAVADTKDKGTDYGVMPIAYVYGTDVYIEDVVCEHGTPEMVQGKFVQKLLEHQVKQCRFESNSAGGKVADFVNEEVRKRGGNTPITRKFSGGNKETRIQVNSPIIKNRFLFRYNFNRTTEYGVFMTMLCNFVLSGKNKHDDVPDALSMLVDYWESFTGQKVQLMARPF